MNLLIINQEEGGGVTGGSGIRERGGVGVWGGRRFDLVEEEKWGTEMLQDQVGKDEGYVWNSLE